MKNSAKNEKNNKNATYFAKKSQFYFKNRKRNMFHIYTHPRKITETSV